MTQDKVFLLSYAEANKFFGVTKEDTHNFAARLQPTAIATKNGAKTSKTYKTTDGAEAGWWWLRSPGNDLANASYVDSDGSLHSTRIDDATGLVRPAIWVDLNALSLTP